VERNSIVRKLQVVKLRGQSELPGLHTFRITGDGLKVFPRIPKPEEGESAHGYGKTAAKEAHCRFPSECMPRRRLAQPGDRLEPPEDLFDPFARALAQRVARMVADLLKLRSRYRPASRSSSCRFRSLDPVGELNSRVKSGQTKGVSGCDVR
jgi:hypothetical protein